MLSTEELTLQFGKRSLFEKVNILFTPGNCYGIIGANGSGKSTFLKILSGEIEPTSGSVNVQGNSRISVLKQDQFAYDDFTVLDTVLRGHEKLYNIMAEKDAIYQKEDFSDEDGERASELETLFGELGGWEADAEAAKLLSDLGIEESLHSEEMKQLEASEKIRVLLAQALFGNPDILLLDEPTNQLDLETSMWLEEFLLNFENTAIVVSHDRHFLNKVCTHIADIDYGKIQLFTGNYQFWRESSELALKQRSDSNKRIEDKRKELQKFVERFSANAAKAKQATARKKLLEKLTLDDIKPSSRKYPYVNFEPEREAGNAILAIENLSKSIDGEVMFQDLTLKLRKGQKIALIGPNDLVKTTFLKVLVGELEPDSGSYKWGESTSQAYFPKDNTKYFEEQLSVLDWLRQFSTETNDDFVRGYLGRMLFSRDEVMKKVGVLSGGEKVRCMLSKMMLQNANVLLLDEPTNHLDLESITSLNNALTKFPGNIIFTSHDHQFIQTIADRIIEITPSGVIDIQDTTLDNFLESEDIRARREKLHKVNKTTLS